MRVITTATIALPILLATVWLPCGPDQPASGEQDVTSQQHAEPQAEHASSATDHAGPESQEAIREILQLRRRHGTVLAGTLLDPSASPDVKASDSSQDFEQALREIAVRSQDRIQAAGPNGPAGPNLSASVSDRPRLAAFSSTTLSHAAGEDPLVVHLRDTSRQLDERAAVLETLGHYDQADQLRRLARRLRHTARAALSVERLSPIAQPGAAGPGPD